MTKYEMIKDIAKMERDVQNLKNELARLSYAVSGYNETANDNAVENLQNLIDRKEIDLEAKKAELKAM